MSLQGVQARGERRTDGRQVSDQSHQGPWFNTADAATYLRYTGKFPLRSVYRFMARHRIVPRYDGKRLLIARVDLERALNSGIHARKSAATFRPAPVD